MRSKIKAKENLREKIKKDMEKFKGEIQIIPFGESGIEEKRGKILAQQIQIMPSKTYYPKSGAKDRKKPFSSK